MSERFPGGIITNNPATPTGPFQSGSAPGIWTLDQQLQYQQQGVWPTAGLTPNYIEEVFSTWLYTGNGSGLNIDNGIDLAGKGGLVWTKSRGTVRSNVLIDTNRAQDGSGYFRLFSNSAGGLFSSNDGFRQFRNNGYTIGGSVDFNQGGVNFASWTFRKQQKFFDCVTYTGNGTAGRTVAHSLGSTPGMVIVKILSGSGSWFVYHRSLGATQYMLLDDIGAAGTSGGIWNNTEPTSSVFTLGNDGSVNSPGQSYLAYVFAHNAGGFGLTGTDNVITCGSFTTDGSGFASVNLGYEPQFLIQRMSQNVDDWYMLDIMRGSPQPFQIGVSNQKMLKPNTADAEADTNGRFNPNATGFTVHGIGGNAAYIYIAIRRGPMRVPTTGTSVFGLNARNGNGSNTTVTGGAGVTDFAIIKNRQATANWVLASRLTDRGYMSSNLTNTEVTASTAILQANPWDVMDGVKVGTGSSLTNQTENTYINYLFDRAPSFMDVVCYTGTGVARTIAHNLAAVPEMIIVKTRDLASNWEAYDKDLNALGTETPDDSRILLNSTAAATANNVIWNSTPPTATVFSVGASSDSNRNGNTFIAYLFATCPGVSKVGSYTGTGATQTINCGFTGGARFVLVKRTSGTGNWVTSDTARGMVNGTNPDLVLNSNVTESAADFFITTAGGFQVRGSDPTVNASGSTYIFLAIA
jgi:hypothetical protein